MIHSPDKNLEGDTENFLNIPRLMSLRLGGQHPDTLQALLTAFAAAYYTHKDRAVEMATELHERLHDTNVRPKRPIECIQIEEKLGLIYYGLGNKIEAAKVLAALAQSLREGEETQLGLFSEGKVILSRVKQEISNIVGEVLEQQWQGAEDAKEGGRLSDAADHLRLFYNLFVPLHGEHEDVTAKVALNLAVALWRAGEQKTAQTGSKGSAKNDARKQQDEAVQILQGIVSSSRQEEQVKRRLEEGLKGWQEQLKSPPTHEAGSQDTSSFLSSVDSRVSMDDCPVIQERGEY